MRLVAGSEQGHRPQGRESELCAGHAPPSCPPRGMSTPVFQPKTRGPERFRDSRGGTASGGEAESHLPRTFAVGSLWVAPL